jgi:hypothetical protein
MNTAVRHTVIALVGSIALTQFAAAQNTAGKPPFRDIQSFVAYVNAHIRAPFDRDSARLPQNGASQILKNAAQVKSFAAIRGRRRKSAQRWIQ